MMQVTPLLNKPACSYSSNSMRCLYSLPKQALHRIADASHWQRRWQAQSSHLCNSHLSVRGCRQPGALSSRQAASAAVAPTPDAPPGRLDDAPEARRKLQAVATALSIPYEHVRSVLQHQPGLLATSTEALRAKIERLAATLGLTHYQALYMVVREPTLLEIAPQDIAQRIAAQAGAIDLAVAELAPLAARQPALLRVSPDRLLEECAVVGRPLGLPLAGALTLLARLTPSELRSLLRLSAADIRGRLDGLRAALEQELGQDTGVEPVALALRQPSLLLLPLPAVAAAAAELCALLRSPAAAQRAADRCPALLAAPPPALRASFDGWVEALSLPASDLRRMVGRQPGLLKYSAATSATRVAGICGALLLPPSVLVAMAARQPALLMQAPDTLASKAQSLAALLGGGPALAASVLSQQPSLLLLSAAALERKLVELVKATGLARAKAADMCVREPLLLTLREGGYAASADALLPALRLERAAFGRLAASHPFLLTVNPKVLADSLQEMGAALGLPPEQVAAMVVNNPRVLEPASQDAAAAGPGGSQAPLRGTAAGGSGGGWEARLSLLCQQLAVSEAVARALVRRYPMVLRRDGAELAAVCGRLRAAAGSSPAWSAQLAEFREEQLEAALRLSDRSWDVVDYLVSAGQQAAIPLDLATGCLAYDIPALVRRFPDFPDWQAARRRQRRGGSARPRAPSPQAY